MIYGTSYEPIFVVYLQLLEPKRLVCIPEMLLNIIAATTNVFLPTSLPYQQLIFDPSYHSSASVRNWQRTDRTYSLVQCSQKTNYIYQGTS